MFQSVVSVADEKQHSIKLSLKVFVSRKIFTMFFLVYT